MRVESIADHPTLVDIVAEWHWNEWGHADPNGSLRGWTEALRRRTNRDRVPMTFVAFDEAGAPVGSVALVEHDMPDRPDRGDLTPWVAGTFVVPAVRGRGVGTALMRHAVAEVARLGLRELFLYTSSARGFYEQLGWVALAEDVYEGEAVTIMSLRV